MHVESLIGEAVNTYIMHVRMNSTSVLKFNIVLPRDSIESIYNEFVAVFPKENRRRFKQLLQAHFPQACGRFVTYYAPKA